MRPYRLHVQPETPLQDPKRRRGRAVFIALATVGLHAAVLASAFAFRAPEKTAPKTHVVSVLTGQVTELGDFQASGLAHARVRN